MKKIIVACGSGVATSQTVAVKLKRLLGEKNVLATVEAVDMKSLDREIRNADIFVSITPSSSTKEYSIPVFNGVSFLTGVGMNVELEKLIAEIKKN